VNKPILTESKSVFAPRGTATYTPKWSIVVLAVACLGVLKFNSPGARTPFGREISARVTPAAPSRPPEVENKSIRVPPKAFRTDTNAIGAGITARHQDENKAQSN
jgi:hypothetical protein